MTLDELKKRATASELTLIEAVESGIAAKAYEETRKRVIEFLRKNMPPSLDCYRMDAQAGTRWLARLDQHMNPEAP